MNTAQLIKFQKPAKPKQEAIVDIQKNEDGYTPLPNYLVDGDFVAKMTGNALKCYVVINRFSKGFSRKNWAMESKFLQRKTGIKKPHTLFEAVKQLEGLGLLSVHREDGKTNKFTIATPCLKTALPINSTTAENGHSTTAENGHSTTAENGHTKKEIDLKENIKINNEDNAHDPFVPQQRGMLQFIEYHVEDKKAYSLKELTQVYSTTQADLVAQAKVSFPNMSPDQITSELKKLAQWSMTAEKRISQKWMTTWLNWLTNAEKPSQQTKPAAAPKTQKPPRHRYGQGVVTPQTGIKTVGGNHE